MSNFQQNLIQTVILYLIKEIDFYFFKVIHIFLTVLVVICSCAPDTDIYSVTMHDGKTVTVNTSQKYYSGENEFAHRVSFSFPRSYDYSVMEKLEYVEDSSYVVNGYDQFFIGCWEKAVFGEWIRNYGLVPNKVYYVATKVYVKCVSRPQDGLMIVPKYGGLFMGYRPDVEPRTFWVDNKDRQASVFTTGVRYIGYDSDGNGIYKEIPSLSNNKNQKLVWNFLIQDNVWD